METIVPATGIEIPPPLFDGGGAGNAGGITTFSLCAEILPEPSTFALGVMGLSMVLFRHRK
jgi:hypothetical protein